MVEPRLSALRQFDTCRLIPSRFADVEDSALAPLSENNAHLADLFELDNATNGRLVAEHGRGHGIGGDELASSIPACATPAAPTWPASAPRWWAMFAKARSIG